MSPKQEPETRQNPRTRRVRQLMLDTAVKVLLNEGAEEVTAVRIAKDADVARTTVYRQWPDQHSLLLATIGHLTKPHHSAPTTGPVEDDIRTALDQLRKRLTQRKVRAIFGAFASRSAQDAAFRDAQRVFVSQLAQPMVDVFQAAAERGEIDPNADCTFEASLLVSPILHCHLMLHSKITDTLIDEVIQRWQAMDPRP